MSNDSRVIPMRPLRKDVLDMEEFLLHKDAKNVGKAYFDRKDLDCKRHAHVSKRISTFREGIQSARNADVDQSALLEPTNKSYRYVHQEQIVSIRRGTLLREDCKSTLKLGRMDKAQHEWMEKHAMIAIRIHKLEKECLASREHASSIDAYTNNRIGGKANKKCTQKFLKDLEHSRLQYKKELQDQVGRIKKKGQLALDDLQNIRSDAEYVKALHAKMESFENALISFKQKQTEIYNDILVKERILEKELCNFQDEINKFDNCMQSGTIHDPKKKTQSMGRQHENVKESAEHDLIIRIRDLNERLIRLEAHHDGWDEREHQTFLRVLAKCQLTDDLLYKFADETSFDNLGNNFDEELKSNIESRVYRALRKCLKAIVTQSPDAIRAHYLWYLQYLQLVNEKKDVIAQWKCKKERERKESTAIRKHSLGLNDTMSPQVNVYNEEQELLRAVQLKQQQLEKRRQENAKRLEDWKRVKAKQEESRLKEEEERHRQEQISMLERRARQLHVKQQVRVYKSRKRDEEKQVQQETPSHSVSSTFLRANSRDAIHSAKIKRQHLEQRERKAKLLEQLPERPNVVLSGPHKSSKILDDVQSKLFEPTAASRLQMLSKSSLRRKELERSEQRAHEAYIPGLQAAANAKTKSFGNVSIQPRKVPLWRRKI